MSEDQILFSDQFPRASKYHPGWVTAGVSGGANPLWLAEWLTEKMDLRPGIRILDLGCGRAMSSIFLHREFGVQVWATDLWFDPSENLQRIRDAGVEDGVFPLHCDARNLPYGADFFDAIVSIDSFFYYGTDDLYLNYVAKFLKPGGQIGIASTGLMQEISAVPVALSAWWTQDVWILHTADWWRRHWSRTGIVDIEVADSMENGWQRWLDWHKVIAPDNETEINALNADQGEHLGYVRVVGRKRADATLSEQVTTIPCEYTRQPLLRTVGK